MGREKSTNKTILKIIALNGSMNRYEIEKESGLIYSTILRRVKALTNSGYLAVIEERPQEKRPTENIPYYSLTWKGFITSLSIDEVIENIPTVLRNSPLLEFPLKETWLEFIENHELFSKEEIGVIAKGIFRGLIEVLPYNLELLNNEQIFFYLYLAIRYVEWDKVDTKNIDERFKKIARTPDIFPYFENLRRLIEKQIEENKKNLEEVNRIIEWIKSDESAYQPF